MAQGYYFISYDHDDVEYAKLIREQVELNEFSTWFDHDLHVGHEWKRLLQAKIARSIGVIVIVTPKTFKSQWVSAECAYARGKGKPVLPLVMAKISQATYNKQPIISDHQYLEFHSDPSEQWPWRKLFDALRDIEKERSIPSGVKNAERALRRDFRPKVWIQAIAHLEKHPHEQATQVLAECAEELSFDVAIPCALALARKAPGDPHGTHALGHALQDHTYESKGSRNEAVNALTRIGSREAAEYLIAAAQPGMSDTHFLNVLLSVIRQLNHQIVYDFFRSLIEADARVWSLDHKTIAVQTLTATGDTSYVNSILKILYMEHSSQHTTKAVIRSLATLMSPEDFANEIIKTMDVYSDGYWKQHNATDQRTRELLQSIIDVDGEATSQALKTLGDMPKMRYLHRSIQQELFRRSQP